MSQKIALVTGASRGLGAAFAQALAEKYHIIAVARTIGGLEEIDDNIKSKGGTASLSPIDITKTQSVTALCSEIHARWGKIDLWMHTAIYAPPLSPLPHIDTKDFDKAIAVNVTATQCLIAMVSPLLRANSQAVFFDDPAAQNSFYGAYGATKAAQIALARIWANEAVNTGPKITIATPRPVATATRARFYPGEDASAHNSAREEAQRLLAEIKAAIVAPKA